MIYCIKAMAERHYGVNVEVLHIEPQREFEAALFDHACDVIIEHIEYLHTEAAKGKKATLFCAPQIHRGLKLVVPQSVNSLDDLKGKTIAVRDLGRPHRITLWLRKVGLEKSVKTDHRPGQRSRPLAAVAQSRQRRMRRLLHGADLFARRARRRAQKFSRQ